MLAVGRQRALYPDNDKNFYYNAGTPSTYQPAY